MLGLISRPTSRLMPAMNWKSVRVLKPLLVKLKAINRIDATETESFGFYLIIRRAQVPSMAKRIGIDDACREQL